MKFPTFFSLLLASFAALALAQDAASNLHPDDAKLASFCPNLSAGGQPRVCFSIDGDVHKRLTFANNIAGYSSTDGSSKSLQSLSFCFWQTLTGSMHITSQQSSWWYLA